MKKFSILILAVGFLFLAASAEAFKEHEVGVPLSFDYYYSYEMVAKALQKLHQAFPHLTRLEEVGKSEEGRAILCLTINNPKTGAELDKPGIWVDGNTHGNEIQGGEVALYLANYLLTQYGSNKEIHQLVDKKCFYVVPVVNPDGRYHFLTDANTDSDNRGLRIPRDDDRDGLVDEDFPDDLDGDGNICQMRKKDPNGRFKLDPEEPRDLIRVKPGEKGEYTILGFEGIDNDGDYLVNEDSEGYVDPNRIWGYDWAPDYVEMGGGDYPFSGAGIKAIAEYMMKKTNICMGWTFHNFGGMFLRGPSSKAEGDYAPEDTALFDYLGEQAERIVPDYRYLISWKGLYATHGDAEYWMFKTLGVYAFTGELFVPRHEAFKSIEEKKKEKSAALSGPGGGEERMTDLEFSAEKERLLFNDHLAQGELFVPWKPFKHPIYGDIEIGGWTKLSGRLSHPFMIKDMVHRNAAAIIFSAQQTPEVKLEVFEVKSVGTNLYRVRTRLVNAKAMPTMCQHARTVKLYPQDMLKIRGDGISVVAGGQLLDIYTDKVNYKEFRPDIQFLHVPGFSKTEHQFLVSGQGQAIITYISRHAGKLKTTVTLK